MRPITVFISIALMLLTICILSLRMGAIPLPWSALINGWHNANEHHYVLTQYRLPRVLLALFVGAALAISGVLVQGIVRNPLASPDILGVNHAASLATVSTLMLVPSLPVLWLPLLAFIGGIAGLLILRLIAGASSPMRLALIGVALSATWASVTDYLILSRPQDINNALLWLTGSLWGRDWSFVIVALPILCVLIPLSLRFCRDLDLLALGDDRASTLGVNIRRIQFWGLALAVALAATSVAVCGPIGFISLVVPHLIRHLVGGRHRWLLPTSAVAGALVLLLADLLARTINPPMELPAGVLTAIIGAPWFFWLLMRMR
ncbi:Fe(3+) dicitrate ABC transporter permease subunit FecD [Pectobacterium punjabense]|uniref:Fe(3+) dicitrate ABC transporter permease subunit FecD n=1 Tax=Pectobacterium punjabense TaxID=2108399 RepID=UPI001BFF459C|nr:Fe(3+) dicitrate ABC transporter permease subunit FecD [Pectobacterium punjabense]MBT9186171.1 Fe(3+) dicitrate ABC transporter permease subunit FecD [Pectobacterium punjabense]MDG0798422.1 Fe(3+) dicitrate ABC transporter permease subunit FecD [Pectobacterium punjabense]